LCRGLSSSGSPGDEPLWRPLGILPMRPWHMFRRGGVAVLYK
jgi:hypothetical protein